MFGYGIEQLIIITGIFVFVAVAWHINSKVSELHKRFEEIHSQFHGLREYLYEIDPQFEEERQLREEIESGEHLGAGKDHSDYVLERKSQGKRTLNSQFIESSE